ncbi:MAG TPA: TonB-dependent receptor [Candidatus Binatia bacterium]
MKLTFFIACLAYCLLAGLFLGFTAGYAQEAPATGDTSGDSGAKSDSGSPPPTSDSASPPTKDTNDTVVVNPEPVVVVITASRGPTVNDAPVATTVVERPQIDTSPVQSSDQLLRDIPVVTLPRNDSHFLHPTGQNVSIRGLGRGRTLVLSNGVPLNDPFGGWIQWNKIPLGEVDRVEVVRGASSNLYGSLAMAGVIQYLSAPTDQKRILGQVDGGSFHTYHTAVDGAGPFWGDLSGSFYGDFFKTDGYPIVLRRGPVDTDTPFESRNGGVKLTWKPNEQLSTFFSSDYYSDSRASGTKLSTNGWWFGNGTAGLDYKTLGGNWQLRFFGGGELFDNNNTSINAARTREVKTLHQHIPVENVGGSLVWWKILDTRHVLTVGIDDQYITADNQEHTFSSTTGLFTGKKHAEGSQQLFGIFGEWSYTPVDPVTITAGLRYDHWWNFNAESAATNGVITSFQDQDKGAFNPRVGVVYHLTPEIGLRAAGYTGFRAPNLNELYRSFGTNPTTFGNSDLGPERVYGGEAGVDWSPIQPLRFSVTGFYNRLKDLIQTLTVNDLSICQGAATCNKRYNVGAAESYGVEFESQYHPIPSVTLTASYALTASAITDYKPNPALVGKWLSNVPRQAGIVSARWIDPEWFDITVRLRMEGQQYANDLNTLKLPGYATVDVYLARELVKYTQAFVSATNLFDKQVITGKTTTVTNIGAPLAVWGGLKFRF